MAKRSMRKPRRILVTGGAGFIGSHLCEVLLAQGHRVTAVDNFVLGTRKNLAHLQGRPRFTFRRVDLLDLPSLRTVFRRGRFDAVFHLAANSDIQKAAEHPRLDFELTFLTTLHVLLCMRDFGVRQLVFSSSSAVYGESRARLREDAGPLRPISHYGAAKLASEGFINSWAEHYGIQAWIFRFPNVVGERLTHGVIYDFLQKLSRNPRALEVLGDGRQTKPYLYVKDVLNAMLCGWQRARSPVSYFNIGVHGGTTVRRIVKIVIRELGVHPRVRYTGGDRGWVGDVPRFEYDVSKLRALGWTARHTSTEAVELAVKKLVRSRR